MPRGSSGKPTREQADLAEVLEMVLDKGIVINADVAVTVGETELLGIELRAAIASFETAAEYGLAFPSGTDMQRVEQASGREPLEGEDAEPIDLGIEASSGGATADDEDDDGGLHGASPGRRPSPTVLGDDGGEDGSGDGDAEGDQGENAEAGEEADAGDDGADDADTDDAEADEADGDVADEDETDGGDAGDADDAGDGEVGTDDADGGGA